jgi:hypothetical protein
MTKDITELLKKGKLEITTIRPNPRKYLIRKRFGGKVQVQNCDFSMGFCYHEMQPVETSVIDRLGIRGGYKVITYRSGGWMQAAIDPRTQRVIYNRNLYYAK